MGAQKYLNSHEDPKIFLATDDKSYLKRMKDTFGTSLIDRPVMRSTKNVLYDDHVNKDQKSREVLMDSLVLGLTSSLVKCWSGVSEFSVYFRQSWLERPTYQGIIDLQIGDGGDEHPKKV